MHGVKSVRTTIRLCILVSACSSSPAAPGRDGAAELFEAGPAQDVAKGPQDARQLAGGPDATANPQPGPDAAQDAPGAPDVAAQELGHDARQLDAGAAELPGQALDADADLGPLCPAGFYAPGIGPGGTPRACDPKAPPGILPCVNGRDGWCPNWCPALTICSVYNWVCCQAP